MFSTAESLLPLRSSHFNDDGRQLFHFYGVYDPFKTQAFHSYLGETVVTASQVRYSGAILHRFIAINASCQHPSKHVGRTKELQQYIGTYIYHACIRKRARVHDTLHSQNHCNFIVHSHFQTKVGDRWYSSERMLAYRFIYMISTIYYDKYEFYYSKCKLR